MKYRFSNAKILSNGEIINGTVLVDNGVIIYVGDVPPPFKEERKIDVNGNLLMSGFVNAHCHTPSTVLRGISDDKPLNEWLDDIIPKERMLSAEDTYWSTMLGIAEYVAGGIVAVEEDYGQLEAVVKAFKKSGIKARVSIGFPNVDLESKIPLEKQLEIVQNAGFRAVCFAHSIYGTSEKNFEIMNTFARKHNLPVSTHLSETLKEVGDCSVKNDLTPPELLEDYGFLDRGATVYHAVHCDKDDLNLLADYHTNIVTCPSSNLKLASGIAPIYAMQKAGLNIGIGTDGAYSNNSYDMFKEMFLVATLNKATLYNAEVVKANEVLDMATKNGAKILGFDKSGDIIKGNDADLILINLKSPHQQPLNDIISNLVYATKSSDVYLTMINGRIVYENGEFYIGEDIQKIYDENQKIKNKLFRN